MKFAKERILPLLIVLALSLVLFPGQVLAAEAIDPERNVTITLNYVYDGKAISGAEFGIYYIASVSPYGEFTLAGEFKDYPVTLDGLDAEGWNTLAQTLYGYAQRDNLPQLDRDVTDGSGCVTFPTKDAVMKPGLYLIGGKVVTLEGYTYCVSPFIVSAPMEDMEQNVWKYDVTVNPKASREVYHDTVTGKVLKVWDDKGYENKRPQYVTVTLLKNGEAYDTQRITAAGNWEYRWEELPRYDENGNEIKWSVRESAVPGYTVNVTQNGDNFVLTNSIDKQKLPQTGVLWWPVPILAVAGLAFLLVGGIIRKRENDA